MYDKIHYKLKKKKNQKRKKKKRFGVYTHAYACIHTHTHSGILLNHKKNEILSFATTWMDVEIITLSEISQKEQDKYYILLTCGI